MRNALVSYRQRQSRFTLRSNGNRSNKPNKSGNLDAERSARMADRQLPEALNFAEGLTALHGIEAEPECR